MRIYSFHLVSRRPTAPPKSCALLQTYFILGFSSMYIFRDLNGSDCHLLSTSYVNYFINTIPFNLYNMFMRELFLQIRMLRFRENNYSIFCWSYLINCGARIPAQVSLTRKTMLFLSYYVVWINLASKN